MISKSKKIVFTNGCFDILHEGHIYLLKEAKKLGDYLIVGLNSDNSIKKLKGEKRPINNLRKRLSQLYNIKEIDEIIVFKEDTPLNIIKKIKPNIIVKGSDYKESEVVGKNIAEKIVIIKKIKGLSTTKIINENKRINKKI